MWGNLYTGQLSEGELYRRLRKTVAINILNYAFLPNSRCTMCFT